MEWDTPPTADMALHAIGTLFHDPDGRRKESANKWLDQLRHSMHLWGIADQLLRQQRDVVSCHFAASAMRQHIQNVLTAESPELQDCMRDNLIFHASQMTLESEHAVVIQLSLAIADMVLLMPDWERPLETLFRILTVENDAPWVLVETLRLIPEELESKHMRLSASRRQKVYVLLDRISPSVSEFLSELLQRTDDEEGRLLNGALTCYTAWLACQSMSLDDFPAHPVAQKMLQLLRDVRASQRMHNTCAECIITMVSNIEGPEVSPPETKLRIFDTIESFVPTCYECIRENQPEKIENFCRIFTSLGEAFVPLMTAPTSEPHFSVKSLDWVVMCMLHVEYDITEGTFHLWSRVAEELFKRQTPTLMNCFKLAYEKLLMVLLKLVQIPAGHIEPLDPQGALIDFRFKASYVLKDVAYILGTTLCFRKIYDALLVPGVTWELIEASLYCMQHMARTLMPGATVGEAVTLGTNLEYNFYAHSRDDKEMVPKVLEGILNLQPDAPMVLRHTSIKLLGVLNVWINGNPESLQSVLNYLLYAMEQPGLIDVAVTALTDICMKCAELMTDHLNGLLEIARNLECIDVNKDVGMELLKGITTVMTVLRRVEIDVPLRQLMSFQLQPLAQIVEQHPVDYGRKGGLNDPAHWLDRASAIIQEMKPNLMPDETHPVASLVQEAWPLFSLVCDKYQADGRIIERICRLMRYAVRVVRRDAEAFLENLVNKIVAIYAVQPHSCFLYLASVLVDEFVNVDEYAVGLLNMLKAFMHPTFAILQTENGLKNNPDTIDDFFRLCARVVSVNPMPFLESDIVVPIVQCGAMACIVDHRDVISSVMKFFSSLLLWGLSTNTSKPDCIPLVQEIIRNHAEALISNIVHACACCLHHSTMTDVAEMLLELREAITWEVFDAHLRTAITGLPRHNSRGFVAAIPGQLQEFRMRAVRAENCRVMRGSLRMLMHLYR